MLTLNCHSLQGFDTNKQINEFVDQVVRENIAIFALQEANQPRKSACVTAEELRDLKYGQIAINNLNKFNDAD